MISFLVFLSLDEAAKTDLTETDAAYLKLASVQALAICVLI